ncbi:MAG: hypothetical protein JNJ60_21505, partial [Rhodocyclaceae bacterium]|nr:hypothetical protein [Rhodocyclaceae bacterium]
MAHSQIPARTRLAHIAAALAAALACMAGAAHAKDKVEKPDLKFGFIKLTDMAP